MSTSSSPDKKSAIEILVAKIGLTGTIIAALLSFVGVVTASYFTYLGIRLQVYGPAWATQTAQAIQGALPASTQPSSPHVTATPIVFSPTTSSIKSALPTPDDISRLPNIMGETFYQNPSAPASFNYHVNVVSGISYIWQFRWCAKNGNYLTDNLNYLNIGFLLNDSSLPDRTIFQYHTSVSGKECYAWATILSGWSKDLKIKLTVLYTIAGTTSDGKYKYAPGQYRHDIYVAIQ